MHLELNRCTLTTLTHAAPSIHLHSWSPGLPCLTPLVITHDGGLSSLDVSKCPTLEGLELTGNDELTLLELYGARSSLRTVSSVGNHRLFVLDMTGCSKLQRLHCNFNANLTSLLLTGCTALQDLHFLAHPNMATFSLAECTSLEHLTCSTNDGLTSLDTAGCSSLQTLDCHDNPSFVELDLSHNPAPSRRTPLSQQPSQSRQTVGLQRFAKPPRCPQRQPCLLGPQRSGCPGCGVL